ncbi:asparaginase domain-containing protein [Pseudobacteriovorax antillogorgiicola]
MIKIISAGGTIDKIYFDANSEFQVGDPQIHHILAEANVALDYELESVLRKDSLDLTDDDRQLIFNKVQVSPQKRIIVTHGTDTMATTARVLEGITDKVIVFTGSMEPAKLKSSDAIFNVGCAITAVQLLPPGVYIAMNGQVLHAAQANKNLKAKRFESSDGEGPILSKV